MLPHSDVDEPVMNSIESNASCTQPPMSALGIESDIDTPLLITQMDRVGWP